MRVFILCLLFLSLLDARIYRKSSINVVLDSNLRLMWLDNKSVMTIQKTHENAILYCNELSHAGYKDWRIPTLEEFKSIVNKKNFKSYINYAFKYNVAAGYWALKAHWRTLWFNADYMLFISGTGYYDGRHKKKFVRCVRDIK